jgi:hypothetical protein
MPIPEPGGGHEATDVHHIDECRILKAGHHCVVDLAAEYVFVSPAILSNVLRSVIFR